MCNVEAGSRRAFESAQDRLDALEADLRAPSSAASRGEAAAAKLVGEPAPADFLRATGRAQEHIAAGDIFQVVLSRRFVYESSIDPFTVYRALRTVNPSPYMYFLKEGEHAVAGASPEMLVRVEGDAVETHPIAGTRPRVGEAEEDSRREESLRADEKERAEHVMLVDLARNDLGRVSRVGSVATPALMDVEHYSHVMHIVSRVVGRLDEGRDALDALVATFPAGTLSGAPKIRAMELIDSLEPSRRGLYGGALGYVDLRGNLDFCIAIRTLLFEAGRAVVQAGSGIVADSNPERELEETEAKAAAMRQALEMATSF
jgi:anthranilate synthase component 1